MTEERKRQIKKRVMFKLRIVNIFDNRHKGLKFSKI